MKTHFYFATYEAEGYITDITMWAEDAESAYRKINEEIKKTTPRFYITSFTRVE